MTDYSHEEENKRCLGLFTKESMIEKTYRCENLPQPLFAKEGKFLPFVKDRRDLVFGVHTIMD